MPDEPDQPDQPHDAGRPEATDLPGNVESQVRRLLREARHDEPMPVEALERLEHALAVEAEAAAAGRPASAPVLPLAHRRRRRAVALLVAAVAIVVIGVSVGQVLRPAVDGTATSASDIDGRVEAAQASRSGAPDRGTASGDDPADPPAAGAADGSSGSAGSASGSSVEAEGSPAPTAGAPGGAAPQAVAPGADAGPRPLLLAGNPPAVRSTRFAADVRAVRRGVARVPRPARGAPTGGFACESADWGPGRAVATLLDGTPSVLVVRPVAGETQVVDLLQCGSGDVLRSVTLPAR